MVPTITRSVFLELAAYGNLLYTCPALSMACEDNERVVIAIAGNILPQLRDAIRTNSMPVLPTVAAILAGEFPEVAALLLSAPRVSIPSQINEYYISIATKQDQTVSCRLWGKGANDQRGPMVLSAGSW